MLIDKASIEIVSGNGGNGAISFLREKYMPKGGPDGGNGGKGGNVYLVASTDLNTLMTFRHIKVIKAEDGHNGDKKNRMGHKGEDVIVKVPLGTIVYDENGSLLADLSVEGEQYLAAKGGRGGRGNAAFKSPRNRIPKIAENGAPGERKRLSLELKLLADAAIIGLPSAGKSTLLNALTRADAPIGDYPFTTLSPNLGVVHLKDINEEFVLADMPGLIEGASSGKGLGIEFLRHIERCRVLIHLVSMDGEVDPYQAYTSINEELRLYGAELEKRPQLVVASKMDAEGAKERKEAFDKQLGFTSLPLATLVNKGVESLAKKTFTLLEKTPPFPLLTKTGEEGGIKVYDARKMANEDFYITHPSDHLFVINGKKVMEKYASINLSTDEGLAKLLAYLTKIGVDEELAAKGAKTGDSVSIGELVFDYVE